MEDRLMKKIKIDIENIGSQKDAKEIESLIKKIKTVSRVNIDKNTGRAVVFFEGDRSIQKSIFRNILKTGKYKIRLNKDKSGKDIFNKSFWIGFMISFSILVLTINLILFNLVF